VPDEQRPTGEQLLEARERILAQLDEIEGRRMDSCAQGGPPDYGLVVARLQEELREIDALDGIEERPAAPIQWGSFGGPEG